MPHAKGVFPAHAQAVESCGYIISLPQASTPPHFRVSCICSSSVSGSPLTIVPSLNVPVGVPSRLAPLSPQIQTTTVFSSSPISSIESRSRPTWWSAFWE